MIIAIEGPNGIGKSYLINNIIKNEHKLTQGYQQLHTVKFPDKKTYNGAFIYEMLNNKNIDQNALAMLFVNERYCSKFKMESYFHLPDITIVDRYSPSNINSLSAKVIYESRGKFDLFERTDMYKDGFDGWFEQVSDYLANKVIDELIKYENLERELGIIQPDHYILLVPKNDRKTYTAIYDRNYSDKKLDTHEGFSQFVFTSLVYRKCAEKKLFSNWLIIEIDETFSINDIFEEFVNIFKVITYNSKYNQSQNSTFSKIEPYVID